MQKRLLAGAVLAMILAVTAGFPQAGAVVETAQGSVTINGPQVLPPL